ncbi:MAG: ATP-binding protein [Chroococcidiopsidaceae cyanobacterium CP_BM_ER_R8_30]|nr:ATP-binding protein [Chroococcidiopsidaceae cyanobacterium CP_BM_ER_R8_30]
MNDTLLEQLLNEDESTTLDFKVAQYPFDEASNEQKSELLKDILAFTNAWRRTDAYILIGVQEIKGDRSRVVGIQHHLDDANPQQFVNSKTQRPIEFCYRGYPFEGLQLGIITIPVQERPVFLDKKDYGKLRKNVVYIRRSTSTVEANPDEIASMGAAGVTRNLKGDSKPLVQYKERSINSLPFTTESLIKWGSFGILPGIIGLICTLFLPSKIFLIIPFWLLTSLSFLVYGIGYSLKKKGYYSISKMTLKSNKNGKIFLMETYSTCPFYSATVKLKVMPKGSDQRIMGICQRNPEQHTFSFDFTTFTGQYYPIVWRKLST